MCVVFLLRLQLQTSKENSHSLVSVDIFSHPFVSLLITCQRAKKVVFDSPGLVDFAIGPVVFVLNLPNGQVLFFGKFKLQKDCNQSC